MVYHEPNCIDMYYVTNLVTIIYLNKKISLNISFVFFYRVFILYITVRGFILFCKRVKTRSSWLNCALRGDETVFWVSVGQQWLLLREV